MTFAVSAGAGWRVKGEWLEGVGGLGECSLPHPKSFHIHHGRHGQDGLTASYTKTRQRLSFISVLLQQHLLEIIYSSSSSPQRLVFLPRCAHIRTYAATNSPPYFPPSFFFLPSFLSLARKNSLSSLVCVESRGQITGCD